MATAEWSVGQEIGPFLRPIRMQYFGHIVCGKRIFAPYFTWPCLFFIVSKSEIPVTPQYQHESLLYCPGLFRRKNGVNDDREVPIDLDARNGKSKRNCPWVGSYFSFLPWGWSESWVKFWFCTSSLRHDQMITQLGGKIIRITEFSDNVPAVPN